MYSATLVFGLLAVGVLSSPAHHGHGHMHKARDIEVIDVVEVYTTVTMGGPQPTNPPMPIPTHVQGPERKQALGGQPNQGGQPNPTHHEAPSTPTPAVVLASPPASSSSAPSTNSPPSSSGNGWLDVHNTYRNTHGAVQMTWDSTLASKAQSEVGSCPNNDVQAGSNWFGSSGSSNIKDALDAWYNEMSTYASQTNNYANNPPANPPQGAPETGHFSQMIWNSSISLGCATSSTCPGSWVTQTICLYEPAGNMVFNNIPQYVENVFPPGGKS